MKKIEKLSQMVSEAQRVYMKAVIGILDEIVPGLDQEAKDSIAYKICWDGYGYNGLEEIILRYDGRAFDNPALTDILEERIQKTKEENKDLEPDIDERYWCETCGSHSHEEHPETGYCFICNTDNWCPENYIDIL